MTDRPSPWRVARAWHEAWVRFVFPAARAFGDNEWDQTTKGVAAVSVAGFAGPERGSYAAGLDEQARRKGVRPIASVEELRADVFESDEELDEFLADLETFRHEHTA